MDIVVEIKVVAKNADGSGTVLGATEVHHAGDNPRFNGHEIAVAIEKGLERMVNSHSVILEPAPSGDSDPAWLLETRAYERSRR